MMLVPNVPVIQWQSEMAIYLTQGEGLVSLLVTMEGKDIPGDLSSLLRTINSSLIKSNAYSVVHETQLVEYAVITLVSIPFARFRVT
jgi:hypothetical protein